MVNIDNVYQKVLAISNKEQRGYITPQEFNLLAEKAQMDVFDSYFYKYGTKLLTPNIDTEIVTDVEILSQKINPFRSVESKKVITTNTIVSVAGINYGPQEILISGFTLPKDVYYLEHIYNSTMSKAYEVSSSKFFTMLSLPKFRPFSVMKPIFCRTPIQLSRVAKFGVPSNSLSIQNIEYSSAKLNEAFNKNCDIAIAPGVGTREFGDSIPLEDSISIEYIRKPKKPEWAYVVVNGKALYNLNQAIHFELHDSEETTLINKILELAGIIINKPDISEQALRNETIQETVKNQ